MLGPLDIYHLEEAPVAHSVPVKIIAPRLYLIKDACKRPYELIKLGLEIRHSHVIYALAESHGHFLLHRVKQSVLHLVIGIAILKVIESICPRAIAIVHI